MLATEIPEVCEKCSIVLHLDERILRESKGSVARLWCQNGHSFIVRLKDFEHEDDILKRKKQNKNKEGLDKTQNNEQNNFAATVQKQIHKTHARNRSVLCGICRIRIYNAGPNQKFHPGKCLVRAKRNYWNKINRMKRTTKIQGQINGVST